MQLAIELGRLDAGNLQLNIDWVQTAERLGVAIAFSAEAWWNDAATPLAYLADKTSTIKLATGIMQTTARTPAMTAMTALALHDLTGGRFVLGLGASGRAAQFRRPRISASRRSTRARSAGSVARSRQ